MKKKVNKFLYSDTHEYFKHNLSEKYDLLYTPIKKKYLIFSTPRTGSEFFCDILRETKKLGVPMNLSLYLTGLYPKEDIKTIAKMYFEYMNKRVGQNGYYGEKIHFGMFKDMFDNHNFMKDHFKTFDYIIFLRRHDKIEQAISFYKLMKGIVATSNIKPSYIDEKSIPYSFENIKVLYDEIIQKDKECEEFVHKSNKKYINIYYEDIMNNFLETMNNVFSFLELPNIRITNQSEMTIQRNEHSLYLKELFTKDLNDMGVI